MVMARSHPLFIDQQYRRAVTNMAFESVVHDLLSRVHQGSPCRVIFQMQGGEAMLTVMGRGPAFYRCEVGLARWADEVILSGVLGLSLEDVYILHLEGIVGSQSPFLWVEGRQLTFMCGTLPGGETLI